jgi:aminopeptidase-like protein
MTAFRTQERAFGASTVFQVISGTPTTTLASQLPRRERWVLLLLDGRRTVADLARLTQRSELDVASTLARFLQWGFIEPVHAVESMQ